MRTRLRNLAAGATAVIWRARGTKPANCFSLPAAISFVCSLEGPRALVDGMHPDADVDPI